jgi:hypothetical protein
MALATVGIELLSPRTFWADPEVTAGWKARWHLSALAPVMTLATVSLVNEFYLRKSIGALRPGCESNTGDCTGSFGMLSTETLAAFSALGYGTGVFLIDTTKWSNGQFHGGAFALQVGVPLVLSVLTAVGRTEGNWETPGQVWGTALTGAVFGFGMGALYAAFQRPECGYTGSLICW